MTEEKIANTVMIISGDREWKNRDVMIQELKKFSQDTIVIHGAARGADTIGGEVAKKLGMEVIPMEAKWHIYGRGAGPVRNGEMLRKLLSDEYKSKNRLVLAFHNNIAESLGTKNMITIAKKAGVNVRLVTEKVDIVNGEKCCGWE